jgi:hypothetical protein
VAVLYRIREEEAEKLPEKRSTGQSNWKNLIGTVPENDLRDFLTEYAVKNKDFREQAFVALFRVMMTRLIVRNTEK